MFTPLRNSTLKMFDQAAIRPGYFDLQVTVFEEVKVAGGGGEKNKKNKK